MGLHGGSNPTDLQASMAFRLRVHDSLLMKSMQIMEICILDWVGQLVLFWASHVWTMSQMSFQTNYSKE